MVGGPGLRNLALGELDGPRLEVLLAEQESLFVEHKADIAKGEGFQLAKAAASFANTMGGWILVGVTGGKVDSTWAAPSGEFVDTIRQRLQGQVDPLPSFAARVLEHQPNKVGVVRVYESADTPHILSDGSIVVREPAQDAKLRKRGRYEANPIRSHYELLQLAQRGEQARHKAEVRFEEGSHPLIEQMLDLRFTSAASSSATWRTIHVHEPALILRLAPLTVTRRWMEWAVSKGTVDKLSALTATLAGPSASVRNVAPHPRGFGVTAVSDKATPWTPGAHISVSTSAAVAVDAGGVLGLCLRFHLHEVGGRLHYHRHIEEGQRLAESLSPLLDAAADALTTGEHLGRYSAHLYWLEMGKLYRRDPERPNDPAPPGVVPVGGELTIGGPQTSDGQCLELQSLCEKWTREFCRASGMPMWLTDSRMARADGSRAWYRVCNEESVPEKDKQ